MSTTWSSRPDQVPSVGASPVVSPPGRSLLVADLRADSVQTAAEGFLNDGFAADTTPAREPAELPLLT